MSSTSAHADILDPGACVEVKVFSRGRSPPVSRGLMLGSMQELMTIGETANRASVTCRALRHYEQIGLLHPVERSAASYRLYGSKSLRAVAFIRRAQLLGHGRVGVRRREPNRSRRLEWSPDLGMGRRHGAPGHESGSVMERRSLPSEIGRSYLHHDLVQFLTL